MRPALLGAAVRDTESTVHTAFLPSPPRRFGALVHHNTLALDGRGALPGMESIVFVFSTYSLS